MLQVSISKSFTQNTHSRYRTLFSPSLTFISAIYQSFQSELWRLRLTAARATVDVINLAESTLSGDGGFAPIKLSAEVLGLGPVFRLKLRLENMASRRREANNLCVLLHAENRHYTLGKPYARLPALAPGVPLTIDFKVTVIIDPTDGLPPSDLTPDNSVIRVMIFKCGQVKGFVSFKNHCNFFHFSSCFLHYHTSQ